MTRHHRRTSGRVFRKTAHLLRNQFAVRALALHQPIRRTVFDDLAGFQHHYPVEVTQRRETMGNRNDGAPDRLMQGQGPYRELVTQEMSRLAKFAA